MSRKTAIAAPAPNPSPDELLEAIGRLTLAEWVEFRDKFRAMTKEPEPRWRVDWSEWDKGSR